MRFTTKINGATAGAEMLEQAYLEKMSVEGLVEKEIKGGYDIRIGEFRAFCPHSKMGEKRSDNSAEYVGKRLSFKIQEYKENGRSILVSNRAIHEEARQEKLEELKKTLHEGMVITGSIASIQSFGAFVDLGGIQALLPVSEISRSRVEDIRSLLSVGQEIEASILQIDWRNERISLSMKSLLADPWETAKDKYPVGSKHMGKVVRLADSAPSFRWKAASTVSCMSRRSARAESYGSSRESAVKLGQTITVEILGVDQLNKRISLKPARSVEEDETTARYLDASGDSTTYNPFAALLKKK